MCHLGYKLQISGLVQGVGFRPLVFELAFELGLHGEVKNDGFGVEIILACTKEECENFIYKLKEKLPPLARIDSIDITEQTTTNYTHFSIGTSLQNAKTTPML
ncbi:carbamoyltransferase HypF, partial [Campylobacter coli]|nr:carbamoyltransferase HypF [Campylobacter coli]